MVANSNQSSFVGSGEEKDLADNKISKQEHLSMVIACSTFQTRLSPGSQEKKLRLLIKEKQNGSQAIFGSPPGFVKKIRIRR